MTNTTSIDIRYEYETEDIKKSIEAYKNGDTESVIRVKLIQGDKVTDIDIKLKDYDKEFNNE